MRAHWARTLGSQLLMALLVARMLAVEGEVHKVLIRDVTTVEGVRDNSLIGYGLVVGLKGSGDR